MTVPIATPPQGTPAATAVVPINPAPREPGQARPRRLKADTLLYIALLFTWVSIWRIQDIIPILGKMKFAVMVEVASVVILLMDRTPERRLKWISSRIITVIALLFGLMVLSLPTSLWAGKGVDFMLFDFMPTVVMMLLLAVGVREYADLEWLAFTHLIGGSVYAVYVYLFCPMGSGGRLGNLIFYDANDFALVMVCSIPFAIYFLRPGVVVKQRIVALFALALFTLMIIRSGSRGGFLGLIGVGVYLVFQYRSVPTRLRLGAVAAVVMVFVVFGSSKYWAMMNTMTNMEDDYNMTSQTGRKAVWNRGLLYITMRPVSGVGIRAFPQAEGKLSPIAIEYAERGHGIKWSVAHNSYIEIGAECGVAGLILFPALLFLTAGTLWKVKRRSKTDPIVQPRDVTFAQTLLASTIGFTICAFFVSAEYFPYLYLLLGLTVGHHAILRRRAARMQRLSKQGFPSGARLTPRRNGPTPPPDSVTEPRSVSRPRPQWLPAGT